MQDVMQLGPFVVKTDMLIMILSSLIGFWALNLRWKKTEFVKKITIDPFVNFVIIMVITWKLSIVLFMPGLISSHPLSLLYYSGGDRGVVIAAILSMLYLWWRSRKDKIPFSVYADLVMTAFLAGFFVYYIIYLFFHPIAVYANAAHVVLSVILYLWLLRKPFASAAHLNQILLWFSMGSLFISFLEAHRFHYLLGFSKLQILYILLAVISIIISLQHNNQTQFQSHKKEE